MTKVAKIPGTAQDACRNALRAGWWERLMVWTFGEKLVSEDDHCRATARRYRDKIYMVRGFIKHGVAR